MDTSVTSLSRIGKILESVVLPLGSYHLDGDFHQFYLILLALSLSNLQPSTPLEHCEWLNKLLTEIWPNYINPKLSLKFSTTVEVNLFFFLCNVQLFFSNIVLRWIWL